MMLFSSYPTYVSINVQLTPMGKPPLRHVSAPVVSRVPTPVGRQFNGPVPPPGGIPNPAQYDRSQYAHLINRGVGYVLCRSHFAAISTVACVNIAILIWFSWIKLNIALCYETVSIASVALIIFLFSFWRPLRIRSTHLWCIHTGGCQRSVLSLFLNKVDLRTSLWLKCYFVHLLFFHKLKDRSWHFIICYRLIFFPSDNIN